MTSGGTCYHCGEPVTCLPAAVRVPAPASLSLRYRGDGVEIDLQARTVDRPSLATDIEGIDEAPMSWVEGGASSDLSGPLQRVRAAALRRVAAIVPMRIAQLALMRVFDRMRMAAIGRVFGITESRVCQILTDDLVDRVRNLIEQEVAKEAAASA